MLMNISNSGLLEIMSHEGLCLEPYLDSVGVWTIGLGQTEDDDIKLPEMGKITIDQAIDLFRRKIKNYTNAVDALKLPLSQTQYDALASFCYNCGPGNLRKLTKGRSIDQIGDALMLYLKPPEIKGRRQKEQNLYKYGKYSNDGHVLVFPVSSTHKPIYSKGYRLDVRPLFQSPPGPTGAPKPIPAAQDTSTKNVPQEAPEGLSLSDIWEWLRRH